MRIRQIGDTFLAIWTGEDGLVRKITASKGSPGATYECEVAPGTWRSWPVRGSRNVVFSEVGQIVPFVKLMRDKV